MLALRSLRHTTSAARAVSALLGKHQVVSSYSASVAANDVREENLKCTNSINTTDFQNGDSCGSNNSKGTSNNAFGNITASVDSIRTIPNATEVNNKSENNGSSGKNSRHSIVKDYLELSKYKLSALVVITTGAGFISSGILPIDMTKMAVACIGTGLCAASASTFNQVIEIERDKLMHRTKMRPLPAGRISVPKALGWGVTTGALGTSMLYYMLNPNVAILGFANLFLYSVPYTYSKQFTEANTWIGSMVGAIPPIMGWAAATGGSIFEAEPMALAALLTLWQFPHFFALSWLYREDYSRGGFKMVACNDPDGSRSAKLILKYTAYMSLFPILTSVTGLTSYMYAVEGSVLNLYLLYLAKKFYDNHSNANAKRVFFASLWYLPLLLAGYIFHSRMWNKARNKDGNQVENLDEISENILDAKEFMKGLCLHELIVFSKPFEKSPLPLCPKVLASERVTGSIATESLPNDSSEASS